MNEWMNQSMECMYENLYSAEVPVKLEHTPTQVS